MIKLVFLCQRRPDISRAEYARRVLDDHVPIALRHHPAMRKYVVNIIEHVPKDAPPLDSIAELSFDTLEDYRERLYDSPEGKKIVQRDVGGFMARAHAYATVEHVHKKHPATAPLCARSDGVKMIAPIVRSSRMSHEQFVDHWLERHAPLALKHHPGMSGYVANVVASRLGDTGPTLDGFAELHFPSTEALAERLFDSPEGRRIIGEDVARFIAKTFGYLTAEHVCKDGDR